MKPRSWRAPSAFCLHRSRFPFRNAGFEPAGKPPVSVCAHAKICVRILVHGYYSCYTHIHTTTTHTHPIWHRLALWHEILFTLTRTRGQTRCLGSARFCSLFASHAVKTGPATCKSAISRRNPPYAVSGTQSRPGALTPCFTPLAVWQRPRHRA